MLHILANTWVTIPVRELKHQVQVHKGQEQMKSLLLVMANLIITAAVTGHQIKEKKPWFPSTSQKFNLTWKQESTSCGEVVGGSEFLVFFALPSFVLHLGLLFTLDLLQAQPSLETPWQRKRRTLLWKTGGPRDSYSVRETLLGRGGSGGTQPCDGCLSVANICHECIEHSIFI